MRNKNNAKQLPDDINKEIGKIIDGLKCPKDFTCYKSGFQNLCRAKDMELEHFLVCLNRNLKECKFSLYLGGALLCQCPLRIYIAKKLKK
jgi:hypothetical protein